MGNANCCGSQKPRSYDEELNNMMRQNRKVNSMKRARKPPLNPPTVSIPYDAASTPHHGQFHQIYGYRPHDTDAITTVTTVKGTTIVKTKSFRDSATHPVIHSPSVSPATSSSSQAPNTSIPMEISQLMFGGHMHAAQQAQTCQTRSRPSVAKHVQTAHCETKTDDVRQGYMDLSAVHIPIGIHMHPTQQHNNAYHVHTQDNQHEHTMHELRHSKRNQTNQETAEPTVFDAKTCTHTTPHNNGHEHAHMHEQRNTTHVFSIPPLNTAAKRKRRANEPSFWISESPHFDALAENEQNQYMLDMAKLAKMTSTKMTNVERKEQEREMDIVQSVQLNCGGSQLIANWISQSEVEDEEEEEDDEEDDDDEQDEEEESFSDAQHDENEDVNVNHRRYKPECGDHGDSHGNNERECTSATHSRSHAESDSDSEISSLNSNSSTVEYTINAYGQQQD